MLVFSACDDVSLHHALYLTGTYAGDVFEPATLERLDLGGSCFYAPQSFTDANGRRMMFGWLQEERSEAACVAAGWAGTMSVPREVSLGLDGTLWQGPADEVASLRGEPLRAPTGATGVLERGAPVTLGRGDQLDLEVVLRLEPGATVEVQVRATPDAVERTVIRLSRMPCGAASDAAEGAA